MNNLFFLVVVSHWRLVGVFLKRFAGLLACERRLHDVHLVVVLQLGRFGLRVEAVLVIHFPSGTVGLFVAAEELILHFLGLLLLGLCLHLQSGI